MLRPCGGRCPLARLSVASSAADSCSRRSLAVCTKPVRGRRGRRVGPAVRLFGGPAARGSPGAPVAPTPGPYQGTAFLPADEPATPYPSGPAKTVRHGPRSDRVTGGPGAGARETTGTAGRPRAMPGARPRPAQAQPGPGPAHGARSLSAGPLHARPAPASVRSHRRRARRGRLSRNGAAH